MTGARLIGDSSTGEEELWRTIYVNRSWRATYGSNVSSYRHFCISSEASYPSIRGPVSLVPEALWIALVIDHCGYEAARRHCRSLGQAARAAVNGTESPMFVKFSAFKSLLATAEEAIASTLDRDSVSAIRRSLAPLAAVMPDHPLVFLGNVDATPEQDARFPELLRELYDRNSRAAVLSSAIGYELGIDQEKIHVAAHLIDDLIGRFKVINDYPATEQARRAAGAFRASAPTLFMTMNIDNASFGDEAAWVEEFWDHIAGFGPCLYTETLEDESVDSNDSLEQFVFGYRNAVRADLRARLTNWPLDLNDIEVFEVVTALLCRQATLVMEMASSPGIWTPHIAPILLRAIADVFINLAWILKDPRQRSRLYLVSDLDCILKMDRALSSCKSHIKNEPWNSQRTPTKLTSCAR